MHVLPLIHRPLPWLPKVEWEAMSATSAIIGGQRGVGTERRRWERQLDSGVVPEVTHMELYVKGAALQASRRPGAGSRTTRKLSNTGVPGWLARKEASVESQMEEEGTTRQWADTGRAVSPAGPAYPPHLQLGGDKQMHISYRRIYR